MPIGHFRHIGLGCQPVQYY